MPHRFWRISLLQIISRTLENVECSSIPNLGVVWINVSDSLNTGGSYRQRRQRETKNHFGYQFFQFSAIYFTIGCLPGSICAFKKPKKYQQVARKSGQIEPACSMQGLGFGCPSDIKFSKTGQTHCQLYVKNFNLSTSRPFESVEVESPWASCEPFLSQTWRMSS